MSKTKQRRPLGAPDDWRKILKFERAKTKAAVDGANVRWRQYDEAIERLQNENAKLGSTLQRTSHINCAFARDTEFTRLEGEVVQYAETVKRLNGEIQALRAAPQRECEALRDQVATAKQALTLAVRDAQDAREATSKARADRRQDAEYIHDLERSLANLLARKHSLRVEPIQ